MKKQMIPVLLAVSLLAGCQSLETGTGTTRSHYSQRVETIQQLSGPNRITNREEMKTAARNIVITGIGQESHSDSLTTEMYDGDPIADAKEIAEELKRTDPECAYIVSSITPFETYALLNITEIRIMVVYHPERDIKNITPVLDMKDFENRFSNMMEGFSARRVYRMADLHDSPELFAQRLEKCWAQKAHAAVGLEKLHAEFFPEDSEEAIIEVTATYLEDKEVLLAWQDAIVLEAERIADGFNGETDLEKAEYIFHYLDTNVLVNAATYVQPKSAPYTAYGALIDHSAVQSGFALGAKVLCDKLGLDSTVMIGTYLGEDGVSEEDYYWLYLHDLDGQEMHFDVTPNIIEKLNAEDALEPSVGDPDTSLGSFDETGEPLEPPEFLFSPAQGRLRFRWSKALYDIQ